MGVVRFDKVFADEIEAIKTRRKRLRCCSDAPSPSTPSSSAPSRSASAGGKPARGNGTRRAGTPCQCRPPARQATPALEPNGEDEDQHPIVRPTVESNLIGLALSGGGVRSAAFCLGALQALDEQGVLGRVDYLSTVSGGGYIGTSMVAAMSEGGCARFPFPSELKPEENCCIRHIRDHSNYLFPRGLGDLFDNLGIYLRGLVANAMILLPWLALAAWVTVTLYPTPDYILRPEEHLLKRLNLDHFHTNIFVLARVLAIAVALGLAVWALRRSRRPGRPDVGSPGMLMAALGLIFVSGVALCELQPFVLAAMLHENPGKTGVAAGLWSTLWVHVTSFAWGEATKILAAFSAFVGLFSKIFADALKRDNEKSATRRYRIVPFLAKASVYVAAAAVPLLLWVAYLYMAVWAICDQNKCNSDWQTPGWLALLADHAWWANALATVKAVVPGWGAAVIGWIEGFVAWIGGVIGGLAQDVGWLMAAALSPVQSILPDWICNPVAWCYRQIHDLAQHAFARRIGVLYFVVFVVVFLIQLVLMPNANSLHRLYRDRLSKAFLFHPRFFVEDTQVAQGRIIRLIDRLPLRLRKTVYLVWANGGRFVSWSFELLVPRKRDEELIDEATPPAAAAAGQEAQEAAVISAKTLKPLDELKFSAIKDDYGPYQIINAALNIRGSKYANQRGRDADFFVFTSKYTGSRATGYLDTAAVQGAVPDLDLAAAMAISGAAASSNMGANTIKALTPTLAILNVRLGFWLPNPRAIAGGRSLLAKMNDQFYFAKELFGRLTEDSDLIYLTDGGHIENLGIYELLRRQCALIIAVDAEADPGMNFNSFIALQRHALIDLGTRIDLPWAAIRDASKAASDVVAETGGVDFKTAQQGPHVALGTINYPGDRTGFLFYIKSSITGDENDYIIDYKRRNASFPHETTADQLFSEEQFEVYRALGFHATRRALKGNDKIAMPVELPDVQQAHALLFGEPPVPGSPPEAGEPAAAPNPTKPRRKKRARVAGV